MAFSNLPDDYQTALAEVKMWRERHKQKRTWVGLTDEEIQTIAFESADRESAAIQAEDKLKAKNFS